ncbi:MAG: sigma-54 dependent transcriptional regulator [Spirochaetia bacterium]|jgi:DNA-binding NtrC family response regulator
MKRILVVDDEVNLCDVLSMLLEDDGYEVATAPNGRKAIEILDTGAIPDLVISDLKMPLQDGMELLDHVKRMGRDVPLVMITAYGSIENAVEAMKRGAADFITKPFNKDIIRHVVHNLLKTDDLQRENKLLREGNGEQGIVWCSAAMREIMETVEKVATAPSAILLLGESGTGKEVIARAIHSRASARAKSDFSVPFVSINCPGVPDSLIESELFGYRKGAFTGAVQNYGGKICLADNGILFLDEVGEIPLQTQAKLLKFIEDKTFEPLGSTTRVRVEARIICATNRDIASMVKDGRFREDLYYRINTITINIPPLRERPEDILPLAEHFLAHYSIAMAKRITGFSEEVRAALRSYRWPGNARELRNIIERAVVLSSPGVLGPDCLPPEMRAGARNDPLGSGENRFEQVERDMLCDALRRNEGNISAAARELGVSRDTVRYRIRKHGLHSG